MHRRGSVADDGTAPTRAPVASDDCPICREGHEARRVGRSGLPEAWQRARDAGVISSAAPGVLEREKTTDGTASRPPESQLGRVLLL